MLRLASVWRAIPPAIEQTSKESLDDAKFVIQDIGNWIKNADAKSTVAAAATGVVATATASKADVIRAALVNQQFHCKWLLLALVIASVASLVASASYQYRALTPRTTSSGPNNRFAWPSLASKAVVIDNVWSAVRDDAWSQATTLATIARDKYTNFRQALRWFGVGFATSICLIALATWQSTPSGP